MFWLSETVLANNCKITNCLVVFVQGGERQSEDAQTSCWKECLCASYLTLDTGLSCGNQSVCGQMTVGLLITYSDSHSHSHPHRHCTDVFRHIIKQRRLGFLHYILNENSESMMYRFLQAQLKNRTIRDWASKVMEDLKSLGMENFTIFYVWIFYFLL